MSIPAASPSPSEQAVRIADAIELVLSARFMPGARPKSEPDDADAVFAAHVLAFNVYNASGLGVEMRTFQKAGISSRIVAKCLRDGVLVLAPEVA